MSFGTGFNSSNPQRSFLRYLNRFLGSQAAFQTPIQSSGQFSAPGLVGATSLPTGFASSASLFGATPAATPTGGAVFGSVVSPQPQNFGSFGQPLTAFSGAPLPATVGGDSGDGSQGTYGRFADRVIENPNLPPSTPKSYLVSIVALREFLHCQPEMLRAGDYKNGHKRAAGQVRTPVTVTPSGSGSLTFGGGFGGTPSMANSNPHMFGQPSTPFPHGGPSGPGMGQSVGVGGGFGAGMGAFNTPAFGGGQAGFGQPASTPMFGNPQSGTSMLLKQPSGFGSSPTMGVFGQSSSGSSFGLGVSPAMGMSGPSIFGQQSSGSAFGAPSSSGFGIGGISSSSLFGNTASGTPLFSQPASSSSIFGQSSVFTNLQQPQIPHGPGSLFGPQMSPTRSPWNIATPPQQPQMSQPSLGIFQSPVPAPPSAPSNSFPFSSHLTPGVIEILQGSNPLQATWRPRAETRDEFKVKLQCIPVPPEAFIDRTYPRQWTEGGASSNWECFALARQPETSLEDEIKEALEAYERTKAQDETQDVPKNSN